MSEARSSRALGLHVSTLEMTCAGLDAEATARRAVEPSTMSLLGLVRHLAEMERKTFREMALTQARGHEDSEPHARSWR